jgi:hypothetical protein
MKDAVMSGQRKNAKGAIERAEEISGECDGLMINPPRSMDEILAARARLVERIAELEDLQCTLSGRISREGKERKDK